MPQALLKTRFKGIMSKCNKTLSAQGSFENTVQGNHKEQMTKALVPKALLKTRSKDIVKQISNNPGAQDSFENTLYGNDVKHIKNFGAQVSFENTFKRNYFFRCKSNYPQVQKKLQTKM